MKSSFSLKNVTLFDFSHVHLRVNFIVKFLVVCNFFSINNPLLVDAASKRVNHTLQEDIFL